MNVTVHVLQKGVYKVTSPFGMRKLTIGGQTVTQMHNGIDFANRDNVIAPARGRVIAVMTNVKESQTPEIIAKKQTGLYRGNHVILEHGGGVSSYYVHLAYGTIPAKIKVGAIVEKGEVLGQVGTTGYSTGIHLHYEIREGVKAVDPVPYLTGVKKFTDYTDVVVMTREGVPTLKMGAVSVNFRDRPNGVRLGTFPHNAVLVYLGKSPMLGGYEWAEVVYEGKIVYCALNPSWNTLQGVVKEVIKTVEVIKEVVKPIDETITKDGFKVRVVVSK